MAMLLDTTPLRVSRDFRRLWTGQAVSFLGSMVTSAALPFQVYRMTGSSLAVGLLGAAQLVPLMTLSVVAGALADTVDKRRMLLAVSLGASVCSALLALNASLSHPQLWVVYVLGTAASCVMALTFPVVRSLLPMLLGPELRRAAFALQSAYGSFGMMAGPAIGGVLIGAWGLTVAYAVDATSFVLAVAVFFGIAAAPPRPGTARASRASIAEGWRFLRGHSVVMSVFAIDLAAMVFGMPRALFPALADRLGGGAPLYGVLLASVAAGAFVASVLSGWTHRVRRHGRAVIISVACWGGAIVLAGLVHVAAVVVVLFALAGAADMISGVYRSAIAADVTPDDMRGRVSGIELAVYAGGPVVGDIEAGVVGGLVGLDFAIVSGGLACIAAAGWFAARVPSFARYRAPAVSDSSAAEDGSTDTRTAPAPGS